MVNSMYWILGIVWYLLVVIGAWKMFEKAGEAGWKAIIPIYNMYIVFKFAWQTMYFWVWIGLAIVGAWFTYASFGDSVGFMYYASWIINFVQLLIACNLAFRVSGWFGHGIWFALGLYFFPFIFTIVLGFGSSRYVGEYNSFTA